jgi:hypothetical protein
MAGSSAGFFVPDIEELTYQTYEEVTQALFSAHELEVIIFGRYCTWNVEEAQGANIVSTNKG